MKPYHTLKAILLAVGITGSAHAAIIDVVTDNALTEFDATLGVRVLIADQTWTKNNQYILSDRLFIKSGQTLTIEPGTKIYGSFDDNETPGTKTDDKVGSIIAARGGRLIADGTANEPIVFTAIQVLEMANTTDYNGDTVVGPMPTSAQGGLWGGIVLLGNAYVSQSDSTGANIGKAEIEGFLPAGTPDTNPVDGLADAITYGFDATFTRDDADDSGIIRYVSIRHGGYEFAAGREINGLTMGGVGSGTTIEYVEVYANTDDGFEWFGGTVSTNNLVSAFNQDDSFDFDSGHTGTHQFLFSIQNPGLADGGSELDGIESTPSSSANQLAGRNAGLTLSKPIFYNMTLIGPGSTNTKSTIAAGTGQVLTEKGNHGLIVEDYFNGEFYNSVFHDFTQHLAFFRDNANSTGASPAAAHNTIGAFGNGTPGSNATYITGTNSNNLFYNALGLPQNGNSDANTDIGLREYTRNTIAGTGQGTGTFLASIDPRPAPDSPLWGASLQAGAPVEVNYRGAFGTYNWAAGWTALSETGVIVNNIVDVLADTGLVEFDATLGVNVLKQDQTWTEDKIYILTDRLFIKSGQTLTIEPGTRIFGSFDNNETPGTKTDDKVGSIIATRGGRLIADGTSDAPIVFSAIQELEAEMNQDFNGDSVVASMPTSANGGLWGGIVLLGNAYVSQSDSTGANIGKAEIEGFLPAGTPDTNPVDGLADAITYGFDATFTRDDADDSGIIRYVSIRHGGYEFAAGREINGLTMGGVGSGTTIEYVEVYANTDDGFEWFGGTVSTNNLVSAFNQDDSFDFDSGHTGTHQFLFSIQNPGLADGGSELDGIESTPSSSANQLAGRNAGLTLSKPIFYNMTLIGPGSTNTKSTIAAGTGQVLTEKGNNGLIVEDYFNGEFYNSVFHDFTQHLAFFRDNANSTGASPAAAHNTIGAFGNGTPGSNATYITGTNSNNLFYDALGLAQSGNSNANTDIGLREYTRNTIAGTGPGTGTFLATIDPRPALDSPLWGASLQAGAPVVVTYRGAFGTENWTAGWTRFDQVYGVVGEAGEDTTPPTITLIGSNPINLTVGDSFTDPGANVTDNIDAPRTITGTGSVNTAVANTYVLTYNTTDEAGNAATTVTRNVIVSAPEIELPESEDFRTSAGSPLNIANYFQTAPFDTATVTVVGILPKGMTFTPGTKLISGYPQGAGTATFLVTLPGEAPVQFVMNFSLEPVPARLLGKHVLHNSDGDEITVTISSKGTAVTIQKPGISLISLKGAILKYNDGADPEEEWTIEVPSSQLSIAFPVEREFKAGDNSYLGNYGTFEGDVMWGFKASTGLGTIVMSKGGVTVTITAAISTKGVAWSVTPTGGKAIKATGSISPDGIASIRTTVPGPGLLMGMLRVDEELDDEGVPTGELIVSLLQGFDGWNPVSYTP